MADEALIVQERENARLSTEALLVQGAAGGVMSKKGADHFKKMVKGLNVESEPTEGLFSRE